MRVKENGGRARESKKKKNQSYRLLYIIDWLLLKQGHHKQVSLGQLLIYSFFL